MKRISDKDGSARFIFEHANVLLELWVKADGQLPAANENIVATGRLLPPGVLFAESIQPDSPKTSSAPQYMGNTLGEWKT